MSLCAGAATRDISPRKPMFLFGYPRVARVSTGVHDPLHASALYVTDGERAIMSIAVDVLMLSHDTVRRCRAAIRRATNVPPGNILISATHTHSAPVTVELLAFRGDPVVPPVDSSYLDLVCQAIIDAASEAYLQAEPAQAAVTTATAVGVGGNRHSADGPSDPTVEIVYLRRRDNSAPLALCMVYSMHPTVLHEDSTLVSADFPGYARLYIAEHLPGLSILYHTGPSGNLSPRYFVSGQTFAEAERLGRQLGGAVLGAVRSMREADFSNQLPVSASRAYVQLPGRTFPSVAEAEGLLFQATQEYERLKSSGAAHGPVRTAECAVFGAEERVSLAKAQQEGRTDALCQAYTPTEIQVLSIGDTYLVGLRSRGGR
jgi:neutral ceramidase